MLLAVDVGNTNLTVGLFAGEKIVRQWRLETLLQKGPAWYARALSCPAAKVGRPTAAVFASVVPALNAKITKAIQTAFGLRALAVGPSSKLGLRLNVDAPGQVGADRVVNALALKALSEGPAVCIDFGTATTFDCLDARGDYVGGSILLGPASAARALHEFTAKLPLVKVRKPQNAVGRDTVSCMESGLYFGYVGMIKEVLARTKMELGGKPLVVATGGLAGLFIQDLPGVAHRPDLTLHGLRRAHEIMHHG